MKAFPECKPCIMRQTKEVAEMLKLSKDKRENLLLEIEALLQGIDISNLTPPEITNIAHLKIKELTGTDDLYRSVKKKFNKIALDLYPRLKNMVKGAKDPLNMAIRLSIAGNVIDFGANSKFNIEETIEEVAHKKFAVDDYGRFKRLLEEAKSVLYIGDNAGEIVFDKLFIEELSKKVEVVFAVKSAPVLNDVLNEDAEEVSMTKVAKVIESGSVHAGTDLKSATLEFMEAYKKADFVIAKGQGNLETLDDKKKEIFYLLKFKCLYLAKVYKVSYGDIVIASNQTWRAK